MGLTDFGLCVRTLRLKYGIRLREMAQALSISSPYLSSIELGERKLTQKILNQTVLFLLPEITEKELEELRKAGNKTLKEVPVSNLTPEGRNLVAMFARRLSEGKNIPPDLQEWIEGNKTDDGSK